MALFEPGETTNTDGTGLGLAVVAEVVDAHGWAVAATESVDGGARFEVPGVEFVEDGGADGDADATDDSDDAPASDGEASA